MTANRIVTPKGGFGLQRLSRYVSNVKLEHREATDPVSENLAEIGQLHVLAGLQHSQHATPGDVVDSTAHDKLEWAVASGKQAPEILPGQIGGEGQSFGAVEALVPAACTTPVPMEEDGLYRSFNVSRNRVGFGFQINRANGEADATPSTTCSCASWIRVRRRY